MKRLTLTSPCLLSRPAISSRSTSSAARFCRSCTASRPQSVVAPEPKLPSKYSNLPCLQQGQSPSSYARATLNCENVLLQRSKQSIVGHTCSKLPVRTFSASAASKFATIAAAGPITPTVSHVAPVPGGGASSNRQRKHGVALLPSLRSQTAVPS